MEKEKITKSQRMSKKILSKMYGITDEIQQSLANHELKCSVWDYGLFNMIKITFNILFKFYRKYAINITVLFTGSQEKKKQLQTNRVFKNYYWKDRTIDTDDRGYIVYVVCQERKFPKRII